MLGGFDDELSCHQAGGCPRPSSVKRRWRLADIIFAWDRRVSAAGGRPTTPAPVDQAYGLRDYSVFDNEGHLWTFATPLQPTTTMNE